MYRGVRQVGELSGFPVYENGAIVIARRGAQPWLPVTREEYVRARVEELRADGASMASVAADAEKELAALTDGGAPAYCCHSSRGRPIGVASESEPGTYPVVRLNPACFDGSAGATGVRLLVLGSEQAYAAERRVKPTEPNYQLMKTIREQLDWNGLAAMVK